MAGMPCFVQKLLIPNQLGRDGLEGFKVQRLIIFQLSTCNNQLSWISTSLHMSGVIIESSIIQITILEKSFE
jgi:hypothetical protein